MRDNALKALSTDDELAEVQQALESTAKGLPKRPRIILQYLKDSKQKMAWATQYGVDCRLWNLIEPKLPGYIYDGGFPTFSITGLKERGLL